MKKEDLTPPIANVTPNRDATRSNLACGATRNSTTPPEALQASAGAKVNCQPNLLKFSMSLDRNCPAAESRLQIPPGQCEAALRVGYHLRRQHLRILKMRPTLA